MKKEIIIFCLLLNAFYSQAQKITGGSLSAGSNYFSSTAAKISFTTGDLSTGKIRNGNNVITQGAEQTYYTYWVAKVSANWKDSLNWNGPFPNKYSDVVILAAMPANPIINSSATCRRLYLKPGAVLTVGSGFSLLVNKQ